MRRLLLVLSVVLVMAAMVVVLAVPAFAVQTNACKGTFRC
jgi:hypothetical protein